MQIEHNGNFRRLAITDLTPINIIQLLDILDWVNGIQEFIPEDGWGPGVSIFCQELHTVVADFIDQHAAMQSIEHARDTSLAQTPSPQPEATTQTMLTETSQVKQGQRYVRLDKPNEVCTITAVGVNNVLLKSQDGPEIRCDLNSLRIYYTLAPADPQYVVLFPDGNWTWRTEEANAIALAEETNGTYIGKCVPIPVLDSGIAATNSCRGEE